MSEPDWLKEFAQTELGQFAPAREALAELAAAQAEVKSLTQELLDAGVKAEDPLTVGTYIQIATRLERQAQTERKLTMMMLLGAFDRFLMKLADHGQGKVE